MYQSRKDMCDHFPYWNFDRVKYLCEKLVAAGVLVTANYNKSKIDKTLWYAFSDEKMFGVDPESSNNFYEREFSPSQNKFEKLNKTAEIKEMFTKGKSALREGKSAQPIPDTITDTKEEKKKPTREARQPAATSIKLNSSERTFEGITEEDLKAWKKLYPHLNLEMEIKKCAEWSMGTYRINYRKTLTSWLSYAEKGPKNGSKNESAVEENREYAKDVHKKFSKNHDIRLELNTLEFCKGSFNLAIRYDSHGFKEQVQNQLRKMGIKD